MGNTGFMAHLPQYYVFSTQRFNVCGSRSFSVCSVLCALGHLFQLLLETRHLGKQCLRRPRGAVGSRAARWELTSHGGFVFPRAGRAVSCSTGARTPRAGRRGNSSRQEKYLFTQPFCTWIDIFDIVSCSC